MMASSRSSPATLAVEGHGPPVLLIPGLDGTGLLFYRQVPLLAERYRVGTLRLPDNVRTMPALVALVREAVAGLCSDGERAILVGESFGGALALSYALTHPATVSRLVILNSFPYFGPQARLWLGYHVLRATPWGVMRLVRQLTAWRMHSRHTGRAELRRFHALMRATTREGYLTRLRMLRCYDVREQLKELTIPTLFLAAEQDHLVPSVEQARLMAGLTPGATLRVLPGHGHICLIAPDMDLGALIEEWEAALSVPGGASWATEPGGRPA
jgi:3-oxoadipate enol-lactonase